MRMRASLSRRPVVACLAAACLLSCVRPYAVWLLPGARLAEPRFGLARQRGGSAILPLYAITVKRCFGQKYATADQAVWDVTDERAANRLPQVSYGTVPNGFTQRRPASPLEVGECYAIDVEGPGITGGTEFRVLPDSTLVERSEAEQRSAVDSAFRREVAHGDSSVAFCLRALAVARSAGDTLRADSLAFRDVTHEFHDLSCGFLRSGANGGLKVRS